MQPSDADNRPPSTWSDGQQPPVPQDPYAQAAQPDPAAYPPSGYPAAQPGYPAAQPGYPVAQPGYPVAQPGYPPDYGAPYPPPYPPAKSSRTPLLVAAIVAVLLAGGGVAAYFLLRGGSASPTDAVNAYFDGYRNGDVKAIAEASCQKHSGRAQEFLDSYREADVRDLTVKVLEERIDGPTATVRAEMSAIVKGEQDTDTTTIDLVQEDGSWRVCEEL